MINRIENEILKYFPVNISENIIPLLREDICEIRIRVGRCIILKSCHNDIMVNYIVSKNEIDKIFESICGNSVYAFTDTISNGFITIQGGHRVGICGKTLYRDEKVYMIKDISSLNFRVAREILGVADKILSKVMINGKIDNTLIISPPGVGKTTLLRDFLRQISNSGYTVGLIDERSEIAGCFLGVPQNDIGLRTDVMDAVSKVDGIKMIVRSMRPDFIATDEIGTDEDAEAIFYAINCGVKIIATAHGNKVEDLYKSHKMESVLKHNIFKKIIVLLSHDDTNVISFE